MTAMLTTQRALEALRRRRGLLLPLGAAGLIFVLLVPLPPGLLDVLLIANLAMAAVVLLTVIGVRTPLEFSVLPTVLLGATLVRLVLNVASTRLILTAGGHGLGEAHLAAGRVIWAFSDFVTAGSLEVGLILFCIVVAIQFIVITKGASRISEVAARFMLDALPGKQMAIDAELNAKSITPDQAQDRRRRVSEEADFYGAMDGASKFIRGDAVAGIVILLVCMLGGLYVGVRQHGLALGEAAGLFARLTIGDGLVTQIPAFITSVAAALLVTRSGARHDLGEQMIGQLSARPAALGLTAGFMALLLLTGLPKLPLLAVGVGLGGLAWMASRRAAAGGGKSPSPAASSSGTGTGAAGPAGAAPAARDAAPSATGGEELPSVDPLRLEVGYGLIGLVEGPASRELLDGIAAMRRRLAGELGLLVPPIRIVDNMRLPSHVYAICLRGRRVGQGEAYPRQLLAVGGRCDQLSGRSTREPTFGAPATWIAPADREAAEALDCTIVEPARVVVTHLGEVVRAHAADLLPREQVARLVEALRLRAPSLVRDVTDRYPLAAIQKVLRALLRERAPVRDLETILEAMGDWMGDGQNIAGITEHVRSALGGAVGQPYCGDDGRLHCVVLDGRLEQTLSASLQRSRGGQFAPVRPESAQKISAAVGTALGELRRSGKAPVLVCSPALRPMLRQIIAASQPDAAVLAYNEIDSAEVRTVQTVGVEL